MKYKLSYLHGMPAAALDGSIGSINDFLFDHANSTIHLKLSIRKAWNSKLTGTAF